MDLHNVIKYPLLTEKSSQKFDQGIYTFAVDQKTNKAEVKHVIEFIFNVKVAKVNILTVRKKAKKLGKFAGFKSGYKKAIVTLQKGYSIQLFNEKTPEINEDKAIKAKGPSKEELAKIHDLEKRAAEKIAAKAQASAKKVVLKEKENIKEDQAEKVPSSDQDEEK